MYKYFLTITYVIEINKESLFNCADFNNYQGIFSEFNFIKDHITILYTYFL